MFLFLSFALILYSDLFIVLKLLLAYLLTLEYIFMKLNLQGIDAKISGVNLEDLFLWGSKYKSYKI